MAGFIRRYNYFPGVETITLIEGVIIVDLPPPGVVTALSEGTVGMVGEFADMTYATAVSAAGVVSTNAQPVEVTSGQDLLDKLGGFDPTIGQQGNNGGNGFVSLRNKKFSRLILCPVNLASPAAGRMYRNLPTNVSATVATPAQALQGGRIEAGREFRSSGHRVHLAKRGQFTAIGHFYNGVDGVVVHNGSTAATGAIDSAGSHFLTAAPDGGPVRKGTIVVLGVLGAGGAQGANAGCYRVQTDAVSDTELIVEKMDGTAFDFTAGTALAFRLHPQTDADTGGTFTAAALADTNGYTLPCRPLDATIAAATGCAPTIVPPAASATAWDPLSGLTLVSHVSSGFVYDANVQQANAPNHAEIDALYTLAFAGLAQDVAPARDINIVFSSRGSSTIRNAVKTHVLNTSGVGLGRMGCISPNLQTTTPSAAQGDSDPGVGANRDERIIYCWPGVQTFVPEAAGLAVGTADGLNTTDGILDVPSDGWMAAVLSNLPPERNPGQSGEPVTTVLSPVVGLQRGLANLQVGDYTNCRARGIAAPRIDRTDGPVFQSGITTSLVAGQKNINRRRMADFIQDSVSAALTSFSKQPLTTGLKDSATGEVDTFLNGLLSPNNPPAQRIAAYSVDDKSGNTDALEAQGIFVIIGRVRTLATADFIVFQTEIGEGVVITTVQ